MLCLKLLQSNTWPTPFTPQSKHECISNMQNAHTLVTFTCINNNALKVGFFKDFKPGPQNKMKERVREHKAKELCDGTRCV